ncbi:MAG: DUF211 domain-containing protein [Halobacteriaceae archaeon]
MARIRRLVLDVLKPNDVSTVEYATAVADVTGVDGVNVSLIETDAEVQNVKLTVEGESVDFGRVSSVVAELGGSVHSIDEVACGETMVETGETPQD